ncbi:MAG TPA: response regulator [Mariprofundaceae bacterium]|nr:response regulator [Mariprofundaceae bacterium]
MAILMIDDDVELCELMQRFLTGEGLPVECAHDGESGLELALSSTYELAIIDVMMPGKNGMDVLRELRRQSDLPVIMLTARGEDMDRIIGLELGADDYLPKPCNPRELAARIRAVLRRTEKQPTENIEPPALIHCGTLEWHPKSHLVFDNGQQLELTSTEYNILTELIRHRDEVVSKQDLSQQALGKRLGPFDRALDMHIANLRKKLTPCRNGEPVIRTMRGVGWFLIEE